jgi:hypothetical protein
MSMAMATVSVGSATASARSAAAASESTSPATTRFDEQLSALQASSAAMPADVVAPANDEAEASAKPDDDAAEDDDDDNERDETAEQPLLPGLFAALQRADRQSEAAAAAKADVTTAAITSAVGFDMLKTLAEAGAADMDALLQTLDGTASVNMAAQNASTPNTAATTAAALTAPLAAQDPGLADALNERIVWLADAARQNGPQQARISLHPAEWGSVQIRVDLGRDGRTTVAFDFETPQARHAVENSLSQLRELLSTTVVTGAAPRFELSGGFGQRHTPQQTQPSFVSDSTDDSPPAAVLTPVIRRVGLLDHFA